MPKTPERDSLDIRLEELFEKPPHRTLPDPQSHAEDGVLRPSCAHHTTLKLGSDLQIPVGDTITFLCSVGPTTYGSPSGVQVPRAHLLRHCTAIRASLENLRIDTITHGPEISADTICRFNACMTEAYQSRLPDFVATAYGTFEQEWGMPDLEDLYVFAVTLGAGAVCDLVIDRWVEDLQRAEPRIVIDEFGEARYFDILDFGSEFLNFLWANDKKGCAFFVDVLVSYGPAGLERMKTTSLANWHKGVKSMLITAIEEGGGANIFSAPALMTCRTFHHHDPYSFDPRRAEKTVAQRTKASHASRAPRRPTLDPGRPRYDDSEEFPPHTLHFSIPEFPHVHSKLSRISPATLDPIYQLPSPGTDRLRSHKTSHLAQRIRYRNEKFNGYYDAKDICRLKLHMCRERAALFKAVGVEISAAEVEKVVEEQELADRGEEDESQDEGGGEVEELEDQSEDESEEDS